MMRAAQPQAIIGMALRSFGEARTALRKGRVDDMINQLTRGAELLELIGQSQDSDPADSFTRPPARRRSTRKAQT